MFSKFLNKQKEQGQCAFTNTDFKPASTSFNDSMLEVPGAGAATERKRRWSYVTYLNKGTLHGDGDNLMLGL